MSLRFSTAVQLQLVELSGWWAQPRPKARPLFDLVEAAAKKVEANPRLPPVYTRRGTTDIYRVLVPSTPYHLYYCVEESGHVLIAAVWSSQRGDEPPLDGIG